jgi:NodT family efflux transporter outer membrane factor (OMF) lipoprotein
MRRLKLKNFAVLFLIAILSSCAPKIMQRVENTSVPEAYRESTDTLNSAQINWREYFTDPYLNELIDTALSNNQELNILLQEVQVSQNEIKARKGEYLPFVGVKGEAGVEKVGRYTSQGANDANTEIKPGVEFPEPLPNYMLGAYATWELDVWKKLRNAKKSAVLKYLSTVEGKNFMTTNLIAEIANTYYELLALDNQLEIINQNIQIQTNALKIVKLEKQSAKVTELAVKRFEAQVLGTKSLKYEINQKIFELENRLNFLAGRYPQPIKRSSEQFMDLLPDTIYAGVPSQLLSLRPDIRQAEQELAAAKLDIKVARANFYPSFQISAGVGFNAFKPEYFVRSPESILFSLIGELAAPLINRNAIKAEYYSANNRQTQAVYNYEQTILNAYVEVANQISMIENLRQKYNLKSQQVDALISSVKISNDLFKSARADYMEVLLTQRDALESRFELIETKKQQMNAMVNMYEALGGGWNQN